MNNFSRVFRDFAAGAVQFKGLRFWTDGTGNWCLSRAIGSRNWLAQLEPFRQRAAGPTDNVDVRHPTLVADLGECHDQSIAEMAQT